jgi:hypothetical protein
MIDHMDRSVGRVALIEADLTGEIIGAAVNVHRELGPGLLESAYQISMCHELALRGIPFRSQVELPVEYKGVRLDCGYRIDLGRRQPRHCRAQIGRRFVGHSSIAVAHLSEAQ